MTLSLPHHYREILKGLGEDPEREGLLDTPKPCRQGHAVPVSWL